MYCSEFSVESPFGEGLSEITVVFDDARREGLVRLRFSSRRSKNGETCRRGEVFVADLLHDCNLYTPYDGFLLGNKQSLHVFYVKASTDLEELANAHMRIRSRLDAIIKECDSRYGRGLHTNMIYER